MSTLDGSEGASLSTLKAKLLRADLQPAEIENLAKIMAAWQSAAQAQKFERESLIVSASARAEYFKALTPIFSVLVTLAALLVTVWQSHDSAVRAFQTAQAAQWREAVTTLYSAPGTQREAMKSTAGAFLLKQFLRSDGPYRNSAHDVAAHFLGTAPLPAVFEALFEDLADSTDLTSINDLIRIDRLIIRDRDALQASVNPEGKTLSPGPVADQLVELEREVTLAGQRIARVLQNSNANNRDIDLSDVIFWESDLSGLNVRTLRLKNARVINSSIVGAHLCKVSGAETTMWDGTAWWRAETIQQDLLNHLILQYPFDQGMNYFGTSADKQDYERDKERLAKSHC